MMEDEMSASPTRGLVHGMGQTRVEADWPALTDDEVRVVLDSFGRYEETDLSREALILWQSSRPMSSGALVRFANGTAFVKRHYIAVRAPERLRVEHEFSSYLRARGQSLPAVLQCTNGDTV